jgi:hypothetical protein
LVHRGGRGQWLSPCCPASASASKWPPCRWPPLIGSGSCRCTQSKRWCSEGPAMPQKAGTG